MAIPFKLVASEGRNDPGPKLGKEVVNLSDLTLTDSEESILQRGLRFVPAPGQINHTPLLRAASEFGRRLKLTKYFYSNVPHSVDPIGTTQPFSIKSDWTPPDALIPTQILSAISEIEQEFSNLKIPRPPPNLAPSEQRAIKSLKSNKDIVIQKADKGSAAVIMNKADYLFEGHRQLSNRNHYEKLETFRQPNTASKIMEIVTKMRDKAVISEKQFHYLKPPEQPRPRRFYTLPKIHKPMDSWTVPSKIPPGRPIVSNCSSETEGVSEFIDHFLKLKSTLHPSYLKDTQDLLQKIRQMPVPGDALLITLDVESMYTNINNKDGIEAFKEAFSDYTNHCYYPYVLELLELTLNSNDFEYNGEIFLQKNGVSMGIRFAPSFADIFMAKWEKEALAKCPFKPLIYFRFLDDIIMVWTHGVDKFREFLDILNNHHPSIKLKATISDTSVDFLDTTIFKQALNKQTVLCTKVFFKPTDTHALLHKRSFHPKSTFRGIIKSQILRFRRICSLDSDFNSACSTLFKSLKQRNYSKRMLREIRTEVLRELETKNRIGQELTMPGCSSWGQEPCSLSYACLICKTSQSCSNFTSGVTNQIYPIKGKPSCGSDNMIYLISCLECDMQYVGETGRPFRTRFGEHLRSLVKGDQISAVSKHFQESHPDLYIRLDDLPIVATPLEQIADQGSKEADKAKRLDREQFWIDTLETYAPKGMNEENNYSTKKRVNETPIIPFVIPFSGGGREAANIIRKHYTKLQETFGGAFKQRLIVAYQKHKNLKDLLTSTKI